MTLDQLEVLIKIKKNTFSEIDNISTLIEDGWLAKNDEGLKLTDHAETKLVSILSILTNPKLDPQIIENYEKQIAYEIKHNSKELVKTGKVRVRIQAHPEIMNELVSRYIEAGWEAAHENGAILLKWNKSFRKF